MTSTRRSTMTPWLERELLGWPMLTTWPDGAGASSSSSGTPAPRAPRSAISACSGRLVSRLDRCAVWPTAACRSGSKSWVRADYGTSRPARCTWLIGMTRRRSCGNSLERAATTASRLSYSRPAEVADRTRAVVQDGLQLALGSPLEVCVDPREVVARLPGWLAQRYGVEFQFGRAITASTCRTSFPARRDGRPAGSGSAAATSSDSCSPTASRKRSGALQAPDDAVTTLRRPLADRSHAGRRLDPAPLRLVPELPDPGRAQTTGRRGIALARSIRNPRHGLSERSGRARDRRLARVR